MPTDDTRVRPNPVIAPPPATTPRQPAAAWAAAAMAPAAAAAMESVLVGESLPALARLLEGALREPPPPLALRLETLPHAAATRAPAPAAQLASALAEAISGSGVFFQSHLAQWVGGTRDAASLLAEARAGAGQLAPDTAGAMNLPAVPDSAGSAPLRQQIASFVTGELAFQFAAWPGQDATLAIGSEPEHDAPADPDERAYFARLETDLAELGPVRAVLRLNARGIDIELRAADPDTAATLGCARDSLARAFAAADLHAGRIEVRHERGS
jgi:hypothetical protein